MILLNKKKYLLYLLSLITIFVIIYFYFLEWKTDTMYGDDLYVFKSHSELNGLNEKINIPLLFGKYRPIHGLSLHVIAEVFNKNVNYYYFFNVGIQTLVTLLFALLLNLFFQAPFLSLFFSLIIGLSRFSFFNMAQLLNGGALEGLAMLFFLASLFFVVKALCSARDRALQKQREIAWSILFANLSIYTHERYIVMFLFILLVVLLSPSLKMLATKRKTVLSLMAVFSIILNVVIKKTFYSMAFFVGTASTKIEFSFFSVISFLGDALLAIFQFNPGPEYLTGIKFSLLPAFDKFIVLVLFFSFIIVLVLYLTKVLKAYRANQKKDPSNFYSFLLLSVLFILLLLPAIVTIRLEQRWLQAPFSVFVLMVAVALSSLNFRKENIKNLYLASFAILFVLINYDYLARGGNNIYLAYSEKCASDFQHAINKSIIRLNTEKLFIWEKQNDINNDNGIRWCLADGYIFDFYQHKGKQIIFVDSVYEKSTVSPDSAFKHFNVNTEQLIYMNNKNKNEIVDITSDYLKDSLRDFSMKQ